MKVARFLPRAGWDAPFLSAPAFTGRSASSI